MREIADIQELATLAGQEIGVGEWIQINQERINQFADATNDHQWIHVDVERCKRESPFGTTIAHGFLTLSLIPGLTRLASCLKRPPRHTLNYGLNRVRFVNPVPEGSRVRARVTVLEVKQEKRGWLVRWQITVELDGPEAKPACVAETLSLYVE
jgi:acyl dehydratase